MTDVREHDGNVTRVSLGDREIYLVGTAHVSRKSVEEVRAIIRDLRPAAVCVELDRARYETLVDETRLGRIDVRAILSEGRAGLYLSSLLFAGFQKRLGDRLGVRPGAEMLAAVDAAEELGARVVLADRNVQVTLMRCYRRLGLVAKAQILVVLVMLPFAAGDVDEAEVEKLKDRRAIGDVMATFAEQMPALKTPLIDERDRYLAASITKAEGGRVVAVVGAAHVPGIERHLGGDTDTAPLDVIPKPSTRLRWLSLFFPLNAAWIVLATTLGRLSVGTGVEMFERWLIPTSGIGTLLGLVAGAHVLTGLSCVLGAPLAMLLPGRLGRAAGALEARVRPPPPSDGVRARDDILEPRRARKNRFLAPMLVAVFTSFGYALGSVIGLLWALIHAFL